MTPSRSDLLIGKIALREGLLTKEQLYDCLVAQERNPSKSLGSIMVNRGYLRNEEVERLLALQRQAFESLCSGHVDERRNALLGRLLADRGLATEYQVNECLRLQGRLAELGIKPVPLLGEILIRRGYINREAMETALQLQNLRLFTCPDCGSPIDIPGGSAPSKEYTCRSCSARVPALMAKMATAVQEALEEASRAHDVELPHEVRLAAADPSKNFGKYILLKEIGRGGAGIVYKAWQRDLNKGVALKILPHESDTAAGVRTPFGDVEDVKRFYNETRAHADLRHPNIVPILDFGSVENHFYYTMQYIEGVTLDGVVREGLDERAFQTTFIGTQEGLPPEGRKDTARIVKGRGMPLRTALEIMRDVALAVDYAHGRGVYHRDIKPANIILDGEGTPWLMDFGLAKVTEIGDSAYVHGVIMGTPYYMPPEQAIGDMEQVDHFSDIYSLGAVLYEMVSGYCPYTGKTPDEVLTLLPKEGPEPIGSHVPDVAPDLAHVIGKAMARDKSGRYPTARDFAADLECLLSDRPLHPTPRPCSVWERLMRRIFPRRRGGTAGATRAKEGPAASGGPALREKAPRRQRGAGDQ